MKIEQVKSLLLGKWKYEDGRIIEFISGEDWNLITVNGDIYPNNKIFFKNKNNVISFTLMAIMEAICVLVSIDNGYFIFDSIALDGSKIRRVLTKI